MAKFRSELRVPVELDQRSFADRYRDRFASDWSERLSRDHGYSHKSRTEFSQPKFGSVSRDSVPTTTTGSSTTSPPQTTKSGLTGSRFVPWHRHFSNGSDSPTDFADGNDWFEEMRRRFDERRRRWDEDVRRMRREFFTLSPRHHLLTRSPSPPSMILPHSRKLSSSQPFSTSYETDPDGTVRFVANFDVNGFDPENMKVTVRDDELLVTAQTANKLGESSTTREYTRSVKLPSGADDRLAAATLTSDGILSISCPVKRHVRSRSSARVESDVHSTDTHDSFSPPSDSHGSGENAAAQIVDRTRTRHIESTYPSSSPHTPPSSTGTWAVPYRRSMTSSVMVRPKFRLELPIDSDYSPSEIQIRTLNRRIYVNARHEEHSVNRTAVREFSKEYDIPDNVDPESLEAKFENGMLYIEAATN